MTPEQYAQAVREALAGHPDRDELLDDLDDHLAEIAAESDVPLEQRLGTPQAYAEELTAAYGGRPGRSSRRWDRVRELRARVTGHAVYKSTRSFLRELRPGWWVLRGYVIAIVVISSLSSTRLVPENPIDLLILAGGVLGSVWYGRRTKGRLLVGAAIGVNVLAAVALLSGVVLVAQWNPRTEQPWNPSMASMGVAEGQPPSFGDETYNIIPYAKDGKPLTDVYLYNQDGRPVITSPENWGYTVNKACGEPVLNRYPLALVSQMQEPQYSPGGVEIPPTPAPCPSVSEVPSASASPAPPASPSEPVSPSPSGRGSR
ncbi:hypothetical protein [Nonomuraea longicatena]|uniref:Uncharacterized protein n=1 Tax=Nonomuraea longicatena TaxID=83682 RepID=A0ABN1QBF4_9ACTN